MAGSFVLSFPSPVSGTYHLVAYNTGNQDLGMHVSGAASNLELVPGEQIGFMMKPTGVVLTDTQWSGLIKRQVDDNPTSGYFFTYVNNTTTAINQFNYPHFTVSKEWENTPFNLGWLRSLPSGNFWIFNNNNNAVFSFPHNLQPNEVSISGGMSTSEKTIDYNIVFPALKNEGHPDYGGNDDLPYYIRVEYEYPDNISPYTLGASGFASGLYYGSGITATGIGVTLPFYDHRETWEHIPATYRFFINYNSAGTTQPGSTPLEVVLNHAKIKENLFPDLTALASSQPKSENLKKVDTIDIPEGVIGRRRLAIGIEDIKSVERVFQKEGTYVSNAYNLDFGIYTFSLKVNEFIPQYQNIDSNEVVKYYVEFNNGEWIRISPVDREMEEENGKTIPKLLIFDAAPTNVTDNVIKYVTVDGIVNNFRIKVVIDLSNIGTDVFIPPEVRNYQCMIFDKEHFASFEE